MKKFVSFSKPFQRHIGFAQEIIIPNRGTWVSLPLQYELSLYKQFFDKDYDLEEFIEGAEKAVRFTRDFLFSKNYSSLKEVLTKECYVAYEAYMAKLEDLEEAILSGDLESIESAELDKILISQVGDEIETSMIVKMVLNEKLVIRKDEELIWGNEDYVERTFHFEFVKKGLDQPWKIGSFLAKPKIDIARMMRGEMDNLQKRMQRDQK